MISPQLYNYNFTFRRDDAKGLTEDEFEKMMDYYQISEAQRYGSRARSLVIDHQESGPIRKTILIFARSKKHRYDVVVAEGKMSINVDWERTGLAAGISSIITGAVYCAIGSILGITVGVLGLLRIGNNIITGPNEDVINRFMAMQLIETQDLVVKKHGKLAFVHGRHHTLLDDDPGTDHSSCCISCFPFK